MDSTLNADALLRWEVLELSASAYNKSCSTQGSDAARPRTVRGRNRRTPAVLDPVQLVKESELAFREQLSGLTVEQLKDVVADHDMDPSSW